jgi:V/A-type H+-transporting ATPase subunit E
VPGLSNILNLIELRANEKIEEIIQEAEKQREQILKRAREKAEKKIEKGVKEAKINLDSNLRKYGASATLRGKHKVLETKEALLTEVLDTAIDQIKKKTRTKGYTKILTRFAVDGGITLSEDDIELVLPKGHNTKIKATTISKQISDVAGKKVKVSISKEHIRASGGVIIRTNDGQKWVDNTFEGRLERLKRQIRDKIAELLFVGKRW